MSDNPFAELELNPSREFYACFTCRICGKSDHIIGCSGLETVTLPSDPWPVAVCVCGSKTRLIPAEGSTNE